MWLWSRMMNGALRKYMQVIVVLRRTLLVTSGEADATRLGCPTPARMAPMMPNPSLTSRSATGRSR